MSARIFLFELILTAIFSFYTLYFIDLGSIARSILTKAFAETENNVIEILRYITEWFVVGFGGMVGTAVIYYEIIDCIIIVSTLMIKDINKLITKLKQNPMKNK
ncbi:hypothetical protein [Staphylococcus equorum]|uniref:hypothetical protein n=1 Tax=Staphylococcus equorum TaxID=246432 RepID=UPI001867A572|nr:hypothetical protein [Staphylococcus equorum]